MPESATPPSWRLPPDGLPLTAFEEYMLLDDRPSHPMVIVARFDFIDDAPPANLAEAFQATLSQEPLLTARVDSTRRGRPRWVPGNSPSLERKSIVSIAGGGGQWTGPLPRLDPRTGPAIHARIVEHTEGWSIVLAVHHAACDGLGMVGFVNRWLVNAEGKTGRRRMRSAYPTATLARRGRVAHSWGQFAGMLPKLARGLEGVGQFITHEVAPLGVDDGVSPRMASAHSWDPFILAATLDVATERGLRRCAKVAGFTVNDLLTTAMLVTVGEQLDTQSRGLGHRDWVRLCVPMSLRTKDDRDLPAVNRVSMVFLDRRPHERHEWDRLARSVHDEMELIRSHGLGHIFPLTLDVGRLLPGGLRRTTQRPKPQCTAVLSNLGRCFHRSPLADAAGHIRIGRGRMAGWWAVPPIRPGTSLAAVTHETAGCRTVALHIDGQRLPQERAHTLLEAVATTLETFAATAGNSAPPPEHAGVA